MTRVLLAGVSTRAAAASALRAGFEVTAVDAFGDLDHAAGASVRVVPRFTARAAVRAARSAAYDVVSYLSSFENHPTAVAALAAGRTLWGNPPDVLTRVRDPFAVAAAFRARGIEAPAVRLKPDTTYNRAPSSLVVSGFSRTWLLKPFASGGGHGVRSWTPGVRVPRGGYLQEFIAGAPMSVVFIAAGGGAAPLGVSRQLIGDPAFGASGYRYCGNVLEPMDAHAPALTLAREAAAAFGLVGANGLDFIARDGAAIPIEINPRWSASMELVERASGVSVFAAHAAACARGVLPKAESLAPGAVGKAIVYAREDVQMGDTLAWLADSSVADIPQPGARVARGRPICTVFAGGGDAARCYAGLVRRADAVYAALSARSEALAW